MHENPERCIVTAYEKYMSCRPVLDSTTAFYLRSLQHPRNSPRQEKDVWFSCQAVDRQKLAGVVRSICEKAGFDGKRTNHSIRVTAATRMFEENIDEQLIKFVSGHRSNAVRDYKRPNNLRKKVSCIVQGQKISADNKAAFNTETKIVRLICR